jgi:hypothetical protein
VSVSVSSGGSITLLDDGTGADQASGDGVYTATWTPVSTGTYTLTFPGNDKITVNVAHPTISVTPSSLDFGGVALGGSSDRTFTVTNSGGGILVGNASTSAPFSIVSGETYDLSAGQSQTVTVRFSPTALGTYTANVTFTGADGASRPVTGAVTEVSSITPSTIDLVAPPSNFIIGGNGFSNLGFGLPVANFYKGGTLIAQARATSGSSTSLTVPYPTNATSLFGSLPGLSVGTISVQVYTQTDVNSWELAGSVPLTVTDSTPPPSVNSISPNPIDLASPPANFTIVGNGFKNLGFGLPVANFYSGTTLIAQARATSGNGTSLTVPYPTSATTLFGSLPGLSVGAITVQVYNQIGSGSYDFSLVGSTSLTVNSSAPPPPPPGVDSISPNPVDIASPPASFAISGSGFANLGFGLPVVNFYLGGSFVAQARATSGNGTSLTVPYPTNATSLSGSLPGLSVGTVTVQVYNQTGSSGWSLVGSTSLTVNSSVPPPPPPSVSSITPNPINLASPPANFTISGTGLVNLGFGLPVVNFYLGGSFVAQARATSGNSSSITVPYPTNATSLSGSLPGLSAGTITVRVYLQTGPSDWSLAGSTSLIVNDSTPPPSVSSITPNPIDLASPPANFTIAGNGFQNLGFGLPVANFYNNGAFVAQARAVSGNNTSLTVPFPTDATTLYGSLPGLNAGNITVQVYNQTGGYDWSLVGSISLTVNDSR